jgi:hypothetical protein
MSQNTAENEDGKIEVFFYIIANSIPFNCP